jgi:hypothetical protein
VSRVVERDVRVDVSNKCCEALKQDWSFAEGKPQLDFSLQAVPARVVASCKQKGEISVQINGRPWKLDQEFTEPFAKNTTSFSKTFEVSFAGENVSSAPQSVRVDANDVKVVTCAPR